MNSVIFYSPSCHSIPVWLSFFCQDTQNKFFEEYSGHFSIFVLYIMKVREDLVRQNPIVYIFKSKAHISKSNQQPMDRIKSSPTFFCFLVIFALICTSQYGTKILSLLPTHRNFNRPQEAIIIVNIFQSVGYAPLQCNFKNSICNILFFFYCALWVLAAFLKLESISNCMEKHQ